jgi:hypothetical protein
LVANRRILGGVVDPVTILAASLGSKWIGALSESLRRSSDEIAEADPKDVQEVAAAQIRIINDYYASVLQQARQSFSAALIAAVVGLFFFLAAVGFVLTSKDSLVSAISVVSGGLVEVIAGINFYLYGRAAQQLSAFHQVLDRTQRFLLANSICENLTEPTKDQARAKLIEVIAGK